MKGSKGQPTPKGKGKKVGTGTSKPDKPRDKPTTSRAGTSSPSGSEASVSAVREAEPDEGQLEAERTPAASEAGTEFSDQEDTETPATMPKEKKPLTEVLAWANTKFDSQGNCQMTKDELAEILFRLFQEKKPSAQSLKSLAEEVQYQGFDPDITLRVMWEVKHKKQITDDQFLKDIATMCVVFLTRGTNLKGMVRKMGEAGKQKVLTLETDYALKKGQQPPKELTLSRVALTFFAFTIHGAVKLKDSLPVPYDFMTSLVPDYPPAMMTQAFASAVPRGKPYEGELVQAHAVYLLEFSKTINPELKNKGEVAILDSFRSALKAALDKRTTKYVDNQVALLIDVGVLADKDTPTAAVKAAAQFFRGKHGDKKLH